MLQLLSSNLRKNIGRAVDQISSQVTLGRSQQIFCTSSAAELERRTREMKELVNDRYAVLLLTA